MFKKSMSALSIFALVLFMASCGDDNPVDPDLHDEHEEHDDEG